MAKDFLVCDDLRCEVLADDFFSHSHGNTSQSRFNNVIADVVTVFPEAILIGAIAAAKYIRHPVEPRMTYDVDFMLTEADFEAFLSDEFPAKTLTLMETYFEGSDSAMHSVKHRQTGIYVDFLSLQSQPLRKKLIRYILSHRLQTTNLLKVGDREVDILKPEPLIVMKLNRYHKNPKTEKGLSDRLDIIKILKTLYANCISVDQTAIEQFAAKAEIKRLDQIVGDLELEMTCEE